MSMESQVLERYSRGARERQASLCCPVDYNSDYLKVIPAEVLEKDYGCGDPSAHLRRGETVLDLGSGGGKVCFIASQIVGPEGRVIGVDLNDDMLALARRHQGAVARAVGWDNVEFCKGRIQDLRLPVEEFERALAAEPVQSLDGWRRAEELARRLRRERPLIADESVDVVVSNCVLNLVDDGAKLALFGEIFRVLRVGGRAVISDVVADREVPERLKQNPELWSGCVSGAMREDEFVKAFEKTGFYGMRILKRQQQPWQVVESVEFRSLTVEAFKGKQGPCLEEGQAVIYKGPWSYVSDDDGHTLRRGERTPVCDKTFRLLTSAAGPYAGEILPLPPCAEVQAEAAASSACEPGPCC